MLYVTFRVGTADYALPGSLVLHLESFDGATVVPGAPPFVAGVVQTRGRVVPVVDLRARFGLPAVERTLGHRIVVVSTSGRVAGLLVDSAREVVQLDESTFQKPPDLVEQQVAGFVTAIASSKQRLFLIVDVPRLIGEPSHGHEHRK